MKNWSRIYLHFFLLLFSTLQNSQPSPVHKNRFTSCSSYSRWVRDLWCLVLCYLNVPLNLLLFASQPNKKQCLKVLGFSYQCSFRSLPLPLGILILSALTANLIDFQSGSFVGSVCLSNYVESSYYSSLSSSPSSSDGSYFWRVFSWDILDLDCFSGSSSSDESVKRLTWFMAAWFTILYGESLRSDRSDYFNSFYSSS